MTYIVQPKRIESSAMAAWPAFEQLTYDGWVLRFAEGFTKRSNSVNPVDDSTLPLEEKIAHCEQLYSARGLPSIFRLTEFSDPPALDDALQTRGYRVLDPTQVMIAPLQETKRAANEAADITAHPMADWLSHVNAMTAVDSDRAEIRSRLLQTIEYECCCLIAWRSGQAVGQVLGIVTHGMLGMFMLTVLPEWRRRGLGTTLTEQLLQWGVSQGVHTAYLQVEASNVGAQNLYTGCGFEDTYRYWYRIAGNDSATLS